MISDDEFDALLKSLSTQSSTGTLVDALQKLQAEFSTLNPESQRLRSLRIANVLLANVIPEAYQFLDEKSKTNVESLLCNRIALSQLVVKVDADPTNQLYADILGRIMISADVATIVQGLDNNGRDYFNSIKKLIVTKIPESLNKAYLKNKDDKVLERSTENYFDSIFNVTISTFHHNIKSYKYYCLLVDELISQDNQLARYFYSDTTIHTILVDMYTHGHPDSKFWRSILKYMETMLDSDSLIVPYITLLKDLQVESSEKMVEFAEDSDNFHTIKALLSLANLSETVMLEHLKNMTEKFGLKSYIERTQTSSQDCLAKYLLLLAANCNRTDLLEMSHYGPFLDCVTNRLDSPLPHTRFLGMVLADFIFERTHEPGSHLFKIESYQKKRSSFMVTLGELDLNKVYSKDNNNLSMENAIKQISNLKSAEHVEEIPNDSSQDLNLPKEAVLDTALDSDDEDLDEDQTTDRVRKVAIPVYLKELLAYISADPEKDKLAYEKRKIAYTIAPQMIRAKKGSEELSYYCCSLLEAVVSCSDTYNFEDFNTWKLSTMIALSVCEIQKCTKQLMKMFVEGDISVDIRVMILNCISLSCRECAGGYQDKFVWGKVGVDNFKPKMLPENIHRQFMKYEDSNSPFIEDTSNLRALNEGVEQLHIGGKVVRISSTLEKQRKGNTNNEPLLIRDTSFINRQLPSLFYSLNSIWKTINMQTGSGFKMGSFSTLLNSEYFKSLGFVYQCAVPSCIELLEITKDFLLSVLSELRLLYMAESLDQVILESLLFDLKSVVDVDTTILSLPQTMPEVSFAIYDALGNIFKSGLIIDDQLSSKCAYVIQKLNEKLF